MTLSSDVVFADGLDHLGSVRARLGPGDWARETPCEGWTAEAFFGWTGRTPR